MSSRITGTRRKFPDCNSTKLEMLSKEEGNWQGEGIPVELHGVSACELHPVLMDFRCTVSCILKNA